MTRNVSGASRFFLKTLLEDGVAAGLTDGQLLERFTTGRAEEAELAFTILVERHGPMVLRTARGILHDDHEAQDAFQATFLILVRKGRSLWVRDSLGAWLHRVACRTARRARAEAARRRALERKIAEVTVHRAVGDDQDELVAAVHEELDRLPDRYRVPIVLCDLEGRTVEEAARHLGCPIGTIGSRLARGRERLRGRLARRGLAPTVGALGSVLSAESRRTAVAAGLLKSTAHLGLCRAAGNAGAGTFSAASAQLAENVLRSLLMVKLMLLGAASLAVVGVYLVANGKLQTGVPAQFPSPAVYAPPERGQVGGLRSDFPFMNDKERYKGFLGATMGNLRPLIEDEKGVRFQWREAIRYKDGTGKLWSPEKKDPVAPLLRHKGPIREITFFDDANLLVTLSDESVKIWDGLTGEPRKELDGQTIAPMWLSFSPGAKRFVTMDSDRRAVTVWDAAALKAVATLHPTGVDRAVALGLSADGKTVAMFRFGPAPSVELWDVTSGLNFATLRLPSSAVAEAFADGGKRLHKNALQRPVVVGTKRLPSTALQVSVGQRDTGFWEVVRSLAPIAGEPKESPVKP